MIEQSLVQGNLKGSIVESLNYMVQVVKSLHTQIHQLRTERKQDTEQAHTMAVDFNKFLTDTKQLDTFNAFLKKIDAERQKEQEKEQAEMEKKLKEQALKQEELNQKEGVTADGKGQEEIKE